MKDYSERELREASSKGALLLAVHGKVRPPVARGCGSLAVVGVGREALRRRL